MSAWIDAFLPTFGLIALGAVLRARVIRDGNVWVALETLTFWVLLPSLLVSSISATPLGQLPVGTFAAAIWPVLLLGTGAAIGIGRLTGADAAATTSLVQGGIRFNTYMALAIVSGLFGQPGLVLAGVVVGVMVTGAQTLVNVVFALSGGGRPSPLRIAVQTIKNPLLFACLLGFAVAALGGLPPGLSPLFRTLGQAALSMGLLCVGAGLSLASLRENISMQVLVGVQKLILVPLAVLALARALGLDPLPAAVAAIVTGMPTAPTAYVMARVLGGDARLMAAIIALQHVAAAVTLPLIAAIVLR